MNDDHQGSKAAWVFVIIAGLVFWLATAAVVFSHEVARSEQRGGYLSGYITTTEQANATGAEVRIETLKCYSSCTFYLSADSVCTTRQTVFGFHGYAAGGEISTEWNAYVAGEMAKLSPSLSKWFMDGPAQSRKLVKLPGADMIDRFGARECV